jgi:GntR family transcriptional regulator, transcriptional repressor for pyruvate dehydrogenase complex
MVWDMNTNSDVVVFQRSKPEKAAQVVAKQIKQTILNGMLPVGARLPSEKAMIEQFGYSRAIIREALRLLESDGLIVLSAGRNGGAVVTTPGTGQIMSSIDMLLRMQQTSITDVFEAQRLIEPIIVRMAIDNGTPEDFRRVRETIDLIEAHPNDVELVREQSNRFHTLLGEATKNHVISIISGILRQIIVDFRYEGDAKEAKSIAHIHGRILDAIEAKDVDVAIRRSLRHVDAGSAVMCSHA